MRQAVVCGVFINVGLSCVLGDFPMFLQSFYQANFIYGRIYTEWKGNKCHPFNSRRGRLKGPKKIYIYIMWGLNLIVFSIKGVSCSVLSTSYCL